MKNKYRLLTVAQFAKEKDVSKATVLYWIKKNRLKDLIRYGKGPWLIPDSNLSVEVRGPGRPPLDPPASPAEAKQRYDYSVTNAGYRRKLQFSYDELQDLFDKGMVFQEIADMSGVTRQRIEQIYSTYFAPFGKSGRERRRDQTKIDQAEKADVYLEGIEKLALLRKILQKIGGYEVEPIQTKGMPWTCHVSTALVNGKRCGVYHSKISVLMTKTGRRRYYRINMSRTSVNNVEFMIIMTGKKAETIFVVPSSVISDTFKNLAEDARYKCLYVPSEDLPVYNNNHPEINWWSYVEAWSQLID